jgi:magnesium transporter
VDDVIDIVQDEGTEDVQKMGGMQALEDPYMQSGFFTLLRKRAGWLTVLFIGEMLTAAAMGRFEGEIARAAVLALFIPLIISSGGNSGSQATSLLIRAIALREVRLREWWRVLMRELPSGFMLGMLLGILGFARVEVWQALGIYDHGPHHLLLAFTVWVSLVGTVTFGTVVGAMLPFVLKRFGLDPASASAPLVATLVDVTGLLIYFTVALLLLTGTYL